MPQPDGPRRLKNSPSRTSRSMWSTATTSPNALTTSTSRTSTSGTSRSHSWASWNDRRRTRGRSATWGDADRPATLVGVRAIGAPEGRHIAGRCQRGAACSEFAHDAASLARSYVADGSRRPGCRRPAAAIRRSTASRARPGSDIDASAVRSPTRSRRQKRLRPPMIALTEGAVIDALRTVQEPELGRDIVTLDMVKDLVHRRRRRRVHDRADDAGLPAQGRDRGQHPRGARRRSASRRSTITWGAMVRRAAAAPGRAARPGRQEHHRGRVRQGRRRQEHGQRQPRRRARPGGRVGRPARRATSPAPTSR